MRLRELLHLDAPEQVCERDGCVNVLPAGGRRRRFCSDKCRLDHWKLKHPDHTPTPRPAPPVVVVRPRLSHTVVAMPDGGWGVVEWSARVVEVVPTRRRARDLASALRGSSA